MRASPQRLSWVYGTRDLVLFLCSAWTWRMAWRDTRRMRKKLLLFSTSIILGVSALCGIGSFKAQLERAVADQAKTLLGADLSLTSRDPFTPEIEQWLSQLGGTQAREIALSSMVLFPKTENTRLVQVRGLAGGFPFYGEFETDPPNFANRLPSSQSVLVEETLLIQFQAQIGDPIKIGSQTFVIGGRLKKVPGENIALATLAPRVYLSLEALERTQLLREGSLARYKVYFKFHSGTNISQLLKELRPSLRRYHFDADTVAERRRDVGRAIENVDRFLALIGFVALLLGGVGIGSAIQSHVKEHLGTVSLLRCLGSPTAQAFAIYAAQALALGLIGACLGAILGCIIQALLPYFASELLPLKTTFTFAWDPLARGLFFGILICLSFALIPLLGVRQASPLAAFRTFYEVATRKIDLAVWSAYALLAAVVLGFALWETGNWKIALGYAAGIGGVLASLALFARATIWTARRWAPRWLPYPGRQALANLYRPGNRTSLLLLSIGLGTSLVLTLYLVQKNLVLGFFPQDNQLQGNAMLFDIQPDQEQPVERALTRLGLPILLKAPVVTMRLHSLKGRLVSQILADGERKAPRWALEREYRSTYREHLTATEQLISGKWHERVSENDLPVPVSLEEGIAERLQVKIGDPLVFDVQGVNVSARVASLRRVEWRRLHPNFFIVFPAGVLEDAPAFHIMLTRVASKEQSAAMQREIVKAFPNVSTVDVGMILETINALLKKISFVTRFIAAFTVGTGIIILLGAILASRFQRIRESILLRVLGASHSQILQILVWEYFLLGLLAALLALLFAVVASWALARHVFEIQFTAEIAPFVLTVFSVCLMTIGAGYLSSRGICNHPPLEILRAED